jgi:surface polysaccharide O-acyltransferase-like enzyme
MTSGYFLASKDLSNARAVIVSLSSRLVPAFLVWALFFNLMNPSAWQALQHNPGGFLLRFILQGGAAPHLWFMPSLILCLALFVLAMRVMSVALLTTGAALLFVGGLALGPYAFLYLGSDASPARMHLARDLPCFGLIFVCAGYWLGVTQWRPAFHVALALFACGAALQLAEGFALFHEVSRPLAGNDYLAATPLFGIGAFLVARSWPFSGRTPRFLTAMGMCSLGLYAVHPVFVMAIGPMLSQTLPLITRLSIWALTVTASIIVAVEMTQFKGLKWLVK